VRAASSLTFLLCQVAGVPGGGTQNIATNFWKKSSGSYTKIASTETAINWLPGGIYRVALDVTSTSMTLSHEGATILSHTLSAGDQTTFNSYFDVGLRANVGTTADVGGSQIDNMLVTQL
jgi:hypothetical protein